MRDEFNSFVNNDVMDNTMSVDELEAFMSDHSHIGRHHDVQTSGNDHFMNPSLKLALLVVAGIIGAGLPVGFFILSVILAIFH